MHMDETQLNMEKFFINETCGSCGSEETCFYVTGTNFITSSVAQKIAVCTTY